MGARRTLAAFLLVLLAVEATARWIEPRVPPAWTWSNPVAEIKAGQLEAMTEAPEVVVLGSSIAAAGIDTMRLAAAMGLGAYNAALPASIVAEWELFFNEVVLRGGCPDVAVFAVSIRDVNDLAGLDWKYDAFRDAIGYRRFLGDVNPAERLMHFAERGSAFLRIRSRLRDPLATVGWLAHGTAASWSDDRQRIDRTGHDTGFARAEPGSGLLRQADNLRTREFGDFAQGGAQIQNLKEAIASARASGVQVLLLDMPTMDGAIADLLPDGVAALDTFHSLMKGVARDLGVDLLTWPDMVDRQEYFADLYHMTQAGADLATDRLGRWLLERRPSEEVESAHSNCSRS